MKSNVYVNVMVSTIFCTMLMSNLAFAEMIIKRIGKPLENPWGMDFIDQNTILITERAGKMYKVDLPSGKRQHINGLPVIEAKRQGGLLDVAIFRQTKDIISVLFCYSKPVAGGTITAIDRAELLENSLVKRKTIFETNQVSDKAIHYGCRLVVDEKYVYASLGDRGARYDAQDSNKHPGSIIRIHKDGRIPSTNPKLNGWAPEIISKGHRNPQGLAIHPNSGHLWSHEHGPRGGDEINIIFPGTNYGWPIVSHGEEYIGGSIGIGSSAPGFADPKWVWTPSIAPSGMAFYKGEMFPQFNGHLLIGSLKLKRLYLVKLAEGSPEGEFIVFKNTIGRIRDVAVAADGSILMLTDETNGGLFRLTKKI